MKLLKYVQYLLMKYFNITATEPYLSIKAGTMMEINGERYMRKIDVYQIVIYRKLHIKKFLYKIGFSITEKQLGLPRRKGLI